MTRKKTKCPVGTIEREGYTRKPYVRGEHERKGYTKKSGTRVEPTTVKEAIIPKTEVGPTCIPDVGKPGKGPKIITDLEKGGLGQYFPLEKGQKVKTLFPKSVNDDEHIKICAKAGRRALKTGKDSYQELSQKFGAMKVFNLRKDPKLVKQAEMCRVSALTGFDPNAEISTKFLENKEIRKIQEKARKFR